MESNKVFLNNFKNEVDEGKYDKYLTLPFMTKKLLYDTVKGKIDKKISSNKTPTMSDREILTTIEEIKETSGSIFYLFLKYGILEKTDTGYQLSRKGKIAITQSNKI